MDKYQHIQSHWTVLWNLFIFIRKDHKMRRFIFHKEHYSLYIMWYDTNRIENTAWNSSSVFSMQQGRAHNAVA
jgi:hypothetical protein